MTVRESLETIAIFKGIGLVIIALVALFGLIAFVYIAWVSRRK